MNIKLEYSNYLRQCHPWNVFVLTKWINVVETFDLESLKRRLSPKISLTTSPDASVAIIINATSDASVLLIRRVQQSGDPWSGQIAFPGGHKSSADHTFLDTAIREADEEIGINLHEHALLGVLPFVPTQSRAVIVAPVVFQLVDRAQIRLNEEVAESFWASLKLLEQVPVTRSEVKVDSGRQVVDSSNYCGHIIWGLTFRILNLLLDK